MPAKSQIVRPTPLSLSQGDQLGLSWLGEFE